MVFSCGQDLEWQLKSEIWQKKGRVKWQLDKSGMTVRLHFAESKVKGTAYSECWMYEYQREWERVRWGMCMFMKCWMCGDAHVCLGQGYMKTAVHTCQHSTSFCLCVCVYVCVCRHEGRASGFRHAACFSGAWHDSPLLYLFLLIQKCDIRRAWIKMNITNSTLLHSCSVSWKPHCWFFNSIFFFQIFLLNYQMTA